MAKRPTINTLTNTASPTYLTQLNQNFTNVQQQFDNTLSLDGSTPNAMNADMDLNGNDLINANSVNTASLRIRGREVIPSELIDIGVKPPVVLLLSGQSNAMSTNAQSAGGSLTKDDRIKFWNGSAFVTMDPANGVGVPVAGRNSIAFQAARAAISDGHSEVFVIISGQAGAAISGWVGSGTSSPQYVNLKAATDAAIAASGYTKVTHFIWAQGESDGGGSVDILGYRASFETLKAQLRAEPWFDLDTPITCLEMPPQGAASTVNMFFLGIVPFDADPYTLTTRTQGLDAGADTLHWTGAAMDIIGLRTWLNLTGVGKQALPAPGVVRHPTPFLQMDPVFGKGLLFQYRESLDQFNMGASSNASYPNAALAFMSFDVDGGWVRLDADAFSAKKHEFFSAVILKRFFGSDFLSATSVVNTVDKADGALYFDSVNERMMVATGPNPTDQWAQFNASAFVTPV